MLSLDKVVKIYTTVIGSGMPLCIEEINEGFIIKALISLPMDCDVVG
jgi:hypothetical protein